MALPSPWPTIHAERKALAADLASLTDEQWATPSLCGGWTVREVLGHMTSTAAMTPPKFFARLAGSGFRFNAMTAKAVAQECEGTPADTLRRFGEHVDSSTHPPGPVDTWLGETIVHSEDIRRPLAIAHDYPVDAVTRVIDSYRKSNLLIGGKNRAARPHVAGDRRGLDGGHRARGHGACARHPARRRGPRRRSRRAHGRRRGDAAVAPVVRRARRRSRGGGLIRPFRR